MKHIFALETATDFENYKIIIDRYKESLDQYLSILKENFALHDLPKGIVWTTAELASDAFSKPIPAFTNKDLIYMSPDVVEWRTFFLQMLNDYPNPTVKEFYKHMSEEHVLTIAGHEFTHHSDLFIDEFDDERADSIWFEEGMCDYLARKHMLSETDFNEITAIETMLVEDFKKQYGQHRLDDFGSGSYENNVTRILFDYWRSYLSVKFLVEEWANHDIKKVFRKYHDWHNEGRQMPLTKYFGVEDLFK